jgi:hypothetical protein
LGLFCKMIPDWPPPFAYIDADFHHGQHRDSLADPLEHAGATAHACSGKGG